MTQASHPSQYLGIEKIGKLLLKFSIPCVIGLIIASLYSIVDQIYIGNMIDSNANAAVGVVFPILIIAQAFAWLFGDGCAAFLAICQGRKDTSKATNSIAMSLVFTLITSLILMAIAFIFEENILHLFGASDEIMELSKGYFTICIFFFPVYMIFSMLNPIIRSDGSPTFSMIAMGTGALLNIILDPIFIKMNEGNALLGVKGAAWATVIGETATFIMMIIYLFNTKTFRIKPKSFIPNFSNLGEAVKLGISSLVTQLAIAAISLACNSMLLIYAEGSKYNVDSIPLAAMVAETKIYTIVLNIVLGIALGGQPILGYNIAAGKYDRVKQTYKLIILSTSIIALVFTILDLIYPDMFFLPFGISKTYPELHKEYARLVFRIFLFSTPFAVFAKVSSIFFQSVGKPVRATVINLVRDALLLVPSILILPIIFDAHEKGSGIIGLLYSAIIGDGLGFILTIFLTIDYFKHHFGDRKIIDYFSFKRKNITLKPSHPGPIICISRETGTGGEDIAMDTAIELGIPFYNKEMICKIAEESGLALQFLETLSSNDMALANSMYLGSNPTAEAIKAIDDVLNKIAEQGSCVILGRAADYLLKDRQDVISIYLHASKEYRINYIHKFDTTKTKEEVEKEITAIDDERDVYYKNVTGTKRHQNIEQYSLCLDASIGIDETVKTIVDYVNNK